MGLFPPESVQCNFVASFRRRETRFPLSLPLALPAQPRVGGSCHHLAATSFATDPNLQHELHFFAPSHPTCTQSEIHGIVKKPAHPGLTKMPPQTAQDSGDECCWTLLDHISHCFWYPVVSLAPPFGNVGETAHHYLVPPRCQPMQPCCPSMNPTFAFHPKYSAHACTPEHSQPP